MILAVEYYSYDISGDVSNALARMESTAVELAVIFAIAAVICTFIVVRMRKKS